MSAVHQVAHLFLRDPTVSRFPEIAPARRDAALAACNFGCDHLEGEELVAVVDDTRVDGVFVGAVVTTRRYAWRNLSGVGQIAWSDLAQVDVVRGPVVTHLACRLFDGTTVRVPPTSADLAAFFDGIVELPGAARVMSVRPLPSGRATAKKLLLERCHRHGRGQHRGGWISPSAPNELARSLSTLFGPPTSKAVDGEHYVCDFSLPLGWQRVGVLENDALRGDGYGLAVDRLRVVAQPTWPGARFRVLAVRDGAPTTPLSRANPVLLASILGELGRLEAQLASTPRPSLRLVRAVQL